MKHNYHFFNYLAAFFLLLPFMSHAQLSLRAQTDAYSDSVNYVPNDSNTYSYSGGRTGMPAYAGYYTWQYQGKCDTMYTRNHNSLNNRYYISSRYFQTFDANNNLLAHFDQAYDTNFHVYLYSDRIHYTYDANNNQVSILTETWTSQYGWQNNSRNGFAYDANNNMLTDTTWYYDATSHWVPSYLTINTYDNHHDLTSTTAKSWDPVANNWVNSQKTVSYFNAGFKADSTILSTWDTSLGWQAYQRDVYTYNAANSILSDTTYYWDTGQLYYSTLNSYAYNGTNDCIGQTIYSWSSNSWSEYEDYINTYDNSHNLLTSISQYFNVNSSLSIYTYNNYNQILTYTTEGWDSSTNSWVQSMGSMQSRYYYESPLAVTNLQPGSISLNIYPIPAGKILNVDINWNTVEQATATIYDMNGRIWKQWNASSSAATYHAGISVSNLPPGNYFIAINSSDGQTSRQFSIVH